MNKVEIIYQEGKDRDSGHDRFKSVEIWIDGKKVAGGRFGGEPEDNSYERDYEWVGQALEKLAKECGALVCTTVEKEEEEL